MGKASSAKKVARAARTGGGRTRRGTTSWVWPGLMAAVAKITPLDTTGAAILLNAVMLFLAVMVGNRLLRTLVNDDRPSQPPARACSESLPPPVSRRLAPR